MTFNQYTFIGHVGADAKLLTTGTEKTFLKFRLAVSDISGKDEATLWLTVLVWNGERAEKLAPFVLKGALVLVTGRILLRSSKSPQPRQPNRFRCWASVVAAERGNTARLLFSPENRKHPLCGLPRRFWRELSRHEDYRPCPRSSASSSVSCVRIVASRLSSILTI